MERNPAIRNILLIWLGWSIVIIAFQALVQMRISLVRPDNVFFWTSSETGTTSTADRAFLSDPFLNAHVAWDSEYYLAIATDGYDSPRVAAIPAEYRTDAAHTFFCRAPGLNCYSLSYAFFPLYSILIKFVSFPLMLFSMTDIARATLAGLIVALLGTLTAMIALYSMTRKSLGEDGGVRAAYYLLIFPSSFFFAQVYSEGVFIGITFAALACILERKWIWAAILAFLAVWTRPGGAILLLPFVIVWLTDQTWKQNRKTFLLRTLAVLSPILSFVVWRLTPLARRFFILENQFFGRGFLVMRQSLQAWSSAWQSFLHGHATTRFYYGLEFAAILFAIVTCILLLRKRPEVSLYGLAMFFFALTSGSAQGMVRYVLAAPAMFIVLAHWGKHQAFDRIWTVACVLLIGLELTLFTFNFWVA